MYHGKYTPDSAPAVKKHSRRVRPATIVFYTIYALFILAFFLALSYGINVLRDWLIRFEASQPVYKCEEVFEDLFADPDWAEIYTLAGVEDTTYEGKEAYAAYMQHIDPKDISYLETSAGLTGGKKYIVKHGEEKIATFTLTSTENVETGIDDWTLGNVEIFFTRRHSVIVEKLPEHTVFINGVPLDDSHTIRTVETAVESYLPEGAHGYRLVQQQLTGLLTEPQVTVTDANGNPVTVVKDPEIGVYRLPVEIMQATEAEQQLALNAIQAYAKYMIRAEGIEAVSACFDTKSEIYDVIRKYEAWTMQSYASYAFTEPTYSDFYRYSDTLFSIRVKLNLNVKRYNGSVKPYELNSTLFFQKQDDKWLAIDMTNADVQEIIEHVRLTFMDGTDVLSSELVDANAMQLTLPSVTPPEGKKLSGWVIQEDDGNGKITLTVIFHPTESGKVDLPGGGDLEPMTLHAHYEEASE